MKKLAVSDEILMQVDKPARYIGGEVNEVIKPLDTDVRFVMCFPDVYEVGMSHLGIQIIYDLLNRREDIWCERVYSPWTDMDKVMRDNGIKLFSLESQRPVKDADFLGITIQFEMCYTNILQVLDLSGMPLYAKDRGEDCPIVIGGGPCAYNPEPIADFFDMFYIGEGETRYYELIDAYKANKAKGGSKKDFLEMAAQIPGMYVPAFYDVKYKEDGTIASMLPNNPYAPEKVKKELVMDMPSATYPEKPLVPFIKAIQDRVVLEIQRGCIRGCRFCQAGMIYRPNRERELEDLKDYAVKMLKSTGHEEISLSSLSSSDYSKLKELVYFLIDEFSGKDVNISLPSLRIDAFSLDVMSKVQDIKKSSLTFAPEAGTQRMRNVINKGLTEEVILNGAAEAFKGGWNKVKLYFMLGLPGETEEDMAGIPALGNAIAATYFDTVPKEQRQGRVQVTISTSFFIPKPFTPLQWAPMFNKDDYLAKAHFVSDETRRQLNHKSLRYMYHEADVSVLEGVMARGDRRVAAAIVDAYEHGCIYDAWGEHFVFQKWLDAFERQNISIAFYNLRERPLDEIFPWDFIDIGVTKDFLKREWKRSQEAVVTPNCRAGCSGCGSRQYGGGVCFESKS